MSLFESARDFISPSIRAAKRDAKLARLRAEEALSKRREAAEIEANNYLSEHASRRSYDAAQLSRFNANWHAPSTSANAALIRALPILRNRSRDIVRNTPYGARAAAIYTSMVAGIGYTVEPKTGNKKRDKMLSDAWKLFSEDRNLFSVDGSVNFNGHLMLAVFSMFESGEDITRIIPQKFKPGQKYPNISFQGLEGDYLDSSKDGPTQDGGVIAGGVEKDSFGRPLAYHLFKEHPGDVVRNANAFQTVRVPANEILHMFKHRRRHMNRGVPALTPVILKMRDQMELAEARMVQQKIAAALAAFIHSNDDPAAKANGEVNEKGDRIESIEPGQIGYLNIGEEITFSTPPSSIGGNDFNISMVKEIAVGVSLPYHMLADDLSEANYSSYRAGMVVFRRLVEQDQEQTVIPMLCQPIWEAFCRYGEAAGLWPSGPYNAVWTAPRFELIDPLKEIEAMKNGMRIGVMSLGDCIASLGWDPDEKIQEIAAWTKRLASLGIVLDSDPSVTDIRGGIQGSADAPAPPSGTASS